MPCSRACLHCDEPVEVAERAAADLLAEAQATREQLKVMALAESAQMCSAKVLSGGRVEAASS